MVDPDEADAALGDVQARREQTTTQLARARPPWWHTALLLGGYYLVIAGAGLHPPALAPLGFALIAAGIAVSARATKRAAVRRPRGYWTLVRVLAVAVGVVAMFVTALLARQLLFAVVGGALVAVLAPIPSTGVFAAMIVWLYRGYYACQPAAAAEAE